MIKTKTKNQKNNSEVQKRRRLGELWKVAQRLGI